MNTKFKFSEGFTETESLLKSFKAPTSVVVKGVFDEAMSDKFATDIANALNTGQNVIPVEIESYGGAAYSLFSMIDTINSCPVPVATIIKGKAMSAGSMLAAAGTKGFRYIAPNAWMMIHEISTGDWGKITEFKQTATQSDALNEVLFAMYDKFGGQVPGYFKKLVHDNGHADIFLSAEETRDHGLVDHIGIPSWEVEVSLTKKMVLK